MALLQRKGLFESNRVLFLPTSALQPNPAQPRTHFAEDGLAELAASIGEHGILQPISVRKIGGSYSIVSGERRLRAAKLVGLREVPCIVIGVNDETSAVLALIENLQRRDLNFWEEALALNKLANTSHLSQAQIAKKIGKSQSAVANKLRLLRLPVEVLNLLGSNGYTERHARALLQLDKPQQQISVAQHVVQRQFNVAQTEEYVTSLSTLPNPTPSHKKPTYIIKDVRLFLNTVHRGLSMMQSAGIDANLGKEETDDAILLTIHIPK